MQYDARCEPVALPLPARTGGQADHRSEADERAGRSVRRRGGGGAEAVPVRSGDEDELLPRAAGADWTPAEFGQPAPADARDLYAVAGVRDGERGAGLPGQGVDAGRDAADGCSGDPARRAGCGASARARSNRRWTARRVCACARAYTAGVLRGWVTEPRVWRSEEHTSELQSLRHLVCRLLLEK